MIKQAVQPPDYMASVYGNTPVMRAANLPGMAAVGVRDLFPDIKPEIYLHGGDLSAIVKATEEALAGVDMSMIKPGDRVNLLCSEHGFSVMEGEPYVEMLKTIWRVVKERSGNDNLRLRVATYRGFREAEEVIEHYKLKEHFDGKVSGLDCWDEGVPIETEIGTLYGIAKVYDCDWFIHAYYDDPREMYFHRMLHRALKAFVMNYARYETRSVFHMNFGNRSCAFIPKVIFDSPFVQERFAFACFLRFSPSGIIAVDADNDLYAIDRRVTVNHLKDYGKVRELMASIDKCIAVWDGGRWGYYIHAGGVCFGVFINAALDPFDLENPGALSVFNAVNEYQGGPMLTVMQINPAIKAVVINQSWPGIVIQDVPMLTPTILVGREQAEMYEKDSANPFFMNFAVTAETLDGAMGFAQRIAGTDKVIIFDGSFGNINCSPSLAQHLIDAAPEAGRRVDEELLPMWLKQRGIDPAQV